MRAVLIRKAADLPAPVSSSRCPADVVRRHMLIKFDDLLVLLLERLQFPFVRLLPRGRGVCVSACRRLVLVLPLIFFLGLNSFIF